MDANDWKMILFFPPKSNKLFLSFGVVSMQVFLLLIKTQWFGMTLLMRRSVRFGSQTCPGSASAP